MLNDELKSACLPFIIQHSVFIISLSSCPSCPSLLILPWAAQTREANARGAVFAKLTPTPDRGRESMPRQQLAEFMRRMGPNSVAVLPAAREATRSNDTEYRFRQDSDFYYLTGFKEPDAVAVLAP